MSYIGAQPTTGSFPFDQFSGNGSTTAFTLTYAPASTTSIIVAISGVVQNPNLYSVIGTTITFSPAPPTGTNNISVLYLGLPVIGVSSPGNTAYFSSTSFTATGGQTTFTPSGSYQVGFINVIRNGSQLAPADYTATNGTTVVLNNACTAGDIVVIEVYTLTSISNALPLTGGTVTGGSTFNTGVNLAVSSGNVGIGTSSPVYQLHTVGNTNGNVTNGVTNSNSGTDAFARFLAIADAGNAQFGMTSSGYTGITGAQDALVLNANSASGGIAFALDGVLKSKIDSSGALLVNTTSATGTVNFSVAADTTTKNPMSVVNTRATAATDFSILFYRAGNIVGSVQTSLSATSYVTSSDYRLKEYIQPMTGALAKVAALKPCTYKWKSDGSGGQGFIAHELAEVVPDAVTGEKDEVDDEGNIKPQGIDTSFLVATLTAAIQEQQVMIEELKAKVAALEAK